MTTKGNPPDREREEFMITLELKPNHGCPTCQIADYIHRCIQEDINSSSGIIKSISVKPVTCKMSERSNLLAIAEAKLYKQAKKRGEIA